MESLLKYPDLSLLSKPTRGAGTFSKVVRLKCMVSAVARAYNGVLGASPPEADSILLQKTSFWIQFWMHFWVITHKLIYWPEELLHILMIGVRFLTIVYCLCCYRCSYTIMMWLMSLNWWTPYRYYLLPWRDLWSVSNLWPNLKPFSSSTCV